MRRLPRRSWSHRPSGIIVPDTSDEPTFGTGYIVRDSDDMQAYTDVDYMGEAARIYEPGQTFVPWPSPAITGGPVNHEEHQILTVGGRQVLRLRYPAGGGGGSWVRKQNVSVPMADESYVQFHARLSSEGALPTSYAYVFATKWILWFQRGGYGRRQCSTHNGAPFHLESAEIGHQAAHGTLWQGYPNGGYTDEYGAYPFSYDQGTQPLGPFFNTLLNDGIFHRFTHGFKDMTPATGTVSVTGNAATFSNPQSLNIGDRIRFDIRDGFSESQPGHARAVTAITDSTHCTVLGAINNTDISPTAFAINGGGAFMRLWIDGFKVIDICHANANVIPLNGDKQWNGHGISDAFLIGGAGRNTDQLLIGSSQTEGTELGICIDLADWLVTSRAA